MKYTILSLLLLCGIVSRTDAELDFSGSLRHRQRPNGLMMAGICMVSTGAAVAGLDAVFAFTFGDTGRTGLYVGAAGVVVVAVGITLILVGKSKQQHTRWGAISPKRNEFGMAYNFK
jgi:hypothetical protein